MPFCVGRLRPVNASSEDLEFLFALHVHDFMLGGGLFNAVLFCYAAPVNASPEYPKVLLALPVHDFMPRAGWLVKLNFCGRWPPCRGGGQLVFCGCRFVFLGCTP